MGIPESTLPQITARRETVEISGGRKLYNYTFEIDGEISKPLTSADVVTAVPVETPTVQKPTDG